MPEPAVTISGAHQASLSFPCRANRGGYVIAVFSGELGIASAPALREQLFDLLRAASHLILDRRARLLGGSLRLAAPSPEEARVLSATGMNQQLTIFPTVRAAITGQPTLPELIFPAGTVPARGRFDGVIASGAAQPARPAIDLATPRHVTA